MPPVRVVSGWEKQHAADSTDKRDRTTPATRARGRPGPGRIRVARRAHRPRCVRCGRHSWTDDLRRVLESHRRSGVLNMMPFLALSLGLTAAVVIDVRTR